MGFLETTIASIPCIQADEKTSEEIIHLINNGVLSYPGPIALGENFEGESLSFEFSETNRYALCFTKYKESKNMCVLVSSSLNVYIVKVRAPRKYFANKTIFDTHMSEDGTLYIRDTSIKNTNFIDRRKMLPKMVEAIKGNIKCVIKSQPMHETTRCQFTKLQCILLVRARGIRSVQTLMKLW